MCILPRVFYAEYFPELALTVLQFALGLNQRRTSLHRETIEWEKTRKKPISGGSSAYIADVYVFFSGVLRGISFGNEH